MRHPKSRVLEREVLEAAGVEILCMEEVGEHAHQPPFCAGCVSAMRKALGVGLEHRKVLQVRILKTWEA